MKEKLSHRQEKFLCERANYVHIVKRGRREIQNWQGRIRHLDSVPGTERRCLRRHNTFYDDRGNYYYFK